MIKNSKAVEGFDPQSFQVQDAQLLMRNYMMERFLGAYLLLNIVTNLF